MSLFIIGNFITFTDPNGTITRWQNFFGEGTVTFNSQAYQLLPFIYQGAQKNKGGDNISSQLTLPANALTLSWIQDAVNNNWLVEVQTYQLTESYAPSLLLGHEYWIAIGLGYTTSAVELQLGNALDAIGAQAPNARITHERVGALPSTGAIRSG
jgi:hypothetical protein